MRLLVLVPDRLSDLVAKGEVQPRYYNPGELADEVHLLMTNDDRPDPAAVQPMVGRARLTLHNFPEASELPTRRGPFALREWRRRRWAAPGVALARRLRPTLMRVHGADWNLYLAWRIRRELGVPYCVSLHINPDVNSPRRYLGSGLSPLQRRHNAFFEDVERRGLRGADLVMPVYRPILPYLERLGVTRVEVCYNVLDGAALREKADYALGDPPRIVCVGRLFDDKDPSNLVRAVASLPRVELTIVGDGPRRPALAALARELGAEARVHFEPAIRNAELCSRLPGFDLFAVHTDYWEINKSVLEALLTGLPVVLNRRRGEPVPELEGDFVRLVENSEEGYRRAIAELLADRAAREALGRRARAHARARYEPAKSEAKVAEIYRRLAASSPYAGA
ncbi:MAG TPA: glycosyltransferase [Myxococcota bacterium]|jgi:glycosyltransferase involved in cell wall biosynthesis|nr:glycosyltransferase [Myxococcota bacterium]